MSRYNYILKTCCTNSQVKEQYLVRSDRLWPVSRKKFAIQNISDEWQGQGVSKNGNSRDTGHIGHTRQRTKGNKTEKKRITTQHKN